MKYILVLGGTGVMGQSLVSLLSGDSAYCLYVTSRSQRTTNSNNIHYVKANAKNTTEILPLLQSRKWDAIIDFMIYGTSLFKSVYKTLLDNTHQYFFMSSCRVYADSATAINENSPRLLDVCKDVEYLKTDDYALLKAREEDILKASGRKNWTIIRPYLTYGFGRLQFGFYECKTWVSSFLNNNALPFEGRVYNSYTTMTTGFDVARQIIALIGNKLAFGDIFQITTSEHAKWSDIFEIYKTILNKEKGINPRLEQVHKDNINEYPAIVKYDRIYNRIFDSSKIIRTTGISDFISLNDGIDKCLSNVLK